MNPILYGLQRRQNILVTLTTFGALTTPQLTQLFFPGTSGERKAQSVLNDMTTLKHLKRTRPGIGFPYLYYVTRQPKISVKEWYPNYTLNGKTFLALVKTDQYYLITDNEDDYQTAHAKNTKANFPTLHLLRREYP